MSGQKPPWDKQSSGYQVKECQVRDALERLCASFNHQMNSRHFNVWVEEITEKYPIERVNECFKNCFENFKPAYGNRFPTLPEIMAVVGKDVDWPKWVFSCSEKWDMEPKEIYDHGRWKCEAAWKLGINVKNLPEHGYKLSDEKRKQLDLPEREDYGKMLGDLKWIASGNMPKDQYFRKWNLVSEEII